MLKLVDLARREDFNAGPLLVSPSRRMIEGPAGDTHVEPIVMKVFLLLLDARGSVVTRDELFATAWGGVFVGDDSLNRAIAHVRRIASDTAPGVFGIETIPRTGYRLTGDIVSQLNDPVDAPASSSGTAFGRRAVVGGAAAALLAAGGAGLWMLRRPATDDRAEPLIERADQILRYDFPNTGSEAVKLLRQAVAVSPRSAKANGLLAYALASGDEDDPALQSVQRMSEIETAIRQAKRIDPNESNALLAQFMVQRTLRDWIPTDQNLRRLLKLDPLNTFAMARLVGLLQAAGLNRESLVLNDRQIALDPLSPGPQFRRALKFWIFGRIPEADMAADQAMQKWPNYPNVWNARFIIYVFTGRPEAALAMLEDEKTRPATLAPLAVQTWRISLDAIAKRTPAAIARARAANLAGAAQAPLLAAYGVMILSALNQVDAAYEIASGFLLSRGRIVSPRATADANFTTKASWRMTQWLFTPPVASFRADPRFGTICDGIGLTAYWRWRGVQPDYRNRGA